jgi:cytochrome c oxidase subunit II
VSAVRGRLHLGALGWPLLAALVAATLAGCAEETPSILRAESEQAVDIRTLSLIMFGLLAGVLLVVWVWLLLAVVKFRRRLPDEEVKQTHGNLKVEALWVGIPAVIVVVLFTFTMLTTGRLVGEPATNVDVRITGYQYWWEVEYPGAEFFTANEIHVPVGRPVTAELRANDVIHSYWVPQMGGKLDMIPGRVNRQTFVPTTEGRYLGKCSEFCGHQHANMRFYLFVHSLDDFSAWFENEASPAREPEGELAEAGLEYIRTSPCAGCHTIRGAGLEGRQGPDLTHFGSRAGIAALTLPNTREGLRAWLRDPQAVKPGNLMPTLPLTQPQLDQLVAYLEGLE